MSAASILVGLDGSAAAAGALRWAARRSAETDASLLVVHVYESMAGPHLRSRALRKARENHARAAATLWIKDALGDGEHTTRVQLEVAEGSPSRVLSTMSRRASLVVLGAPRGDHIHRVLSGSVARRCSVRAACPVVLVPAPDEKSPVLQGASGAHVTPQANTPA